MLLFVLAYIGGVLTIASPCILPVLPFVFARADQPFLRRGLPMLIGMGLTFAVVATLAAVGGGWAVQANEYGRDIAIALLALFGVTLLFPELSDWLTRPLVALGGRLSELPTAKENAGSVWPSLLLGIATGRRGSMRGPGARADPDRAWRFRARTSRRLSFCLPMPRARRPRWPWPSSLAWAAFSPR